MKLTFLFRILSCKECLPNSPLTMTFVVDLLTPSTLLRNWVCTLSMSVVSHFAQSWSMYNLVSKAHLHPTQVGLGIFQAIHCEVIHVSTVYCAVCNLQPVYWSTWLTHEFRHLIVLKLLSVITRNHSTNNACCCFTSSVRLQMRTVPSINEMILGLS